MNDELLSEEETAKLLDITIENLRILTEEDYLLKSSKKMKLVKGCCRLGIYYSRKAILNLLNS